MSCAGASSDARPLSSIRGKPNMSGTTGISGSRGNGKAGRMGKLTPMESRFVKEYAVDLNASAAARRAGYSEKTAGEQACRLLKRVRIQEAIEREFRERQQRTEIKADRVLQELAIIGFADIRDYIDIDADSGAVKMKTFDEMRPNASRAIESISEDRIIKGSATGNGDEIILNDKKKFKLHAKINALELLGRHLGIFKDALPLSGMAFVIVDGEKPKA